jgi:hypothetical protein
MKRVYDSEQQRIKEMQKFYTSQSKKTFNYSPDDFSIDLLSGKWKHKDWKTWMKGDPSGDYAKSKAIVLKYIEECKKPYGQRDLSQFHLVSD